MKYFQSILVAFCIAILVAFCIAIVVFLLIVTLGSNKTPSFGSVNQGNSYMATTTYNFGSQSIGSYKVLKNGNGELGSVIITNSTAGSFNLYDATSTNHGGHATTSLASISASLAAGTYTFDVAFSRGLLVEFQSTNVASGTITYR